MRTRSPGNEATIASIKTLTFLEGESTSLFPHLQTELADAKFVEARSRTNMNVSRLLTRVGCYKDETRSCQWSKI